MTSLGDNSLAKDELSLLIERVERLNDEIKSIQDDRRDVFSEAKARGFEVKHLREVVRLRKVDKPTRDENRAMLDAYLAAMGML